jgi:peptidoglycan/LPS O-acetylase OafA/YrhL
MFWKIREDLISLFIRDVDNKSYLNPIDGLRSIANILIILLHLISIFSAFISPYPDKEWEEYLMSGAFAFNGIMSFSLEIFFMLSSFLLTYKLINEWNQNYPNMKLFLLKKYPLSIIKRAIRFWPGLFLSSLVLLIFGESQYPDSGYLFEFFRHFNIWMFFQNYIDLEYWHITFVHLWSISLDIQIHIILPLIFYLFYLKKTNLSIYNFLFILLLISIIRGIIVFNPLTMPLLTTSYRYPPLPLLSPYHSINWLQINYNLTFSPDIPKVNPMKLFLHKMYFPLEARFGSFIIGSMLAIKLIQNSNHSNKQPKTLKKILFFILIFFHILSMIQSPISPLFPSDLMMKLIIGCSRQLFTIGQAFILFSGLCPSSHPYHSIWIKKFLSLSIWIPISKLSYFVYLIHLRISFELIFGGPLRFLTSYSVTYASLICLPIILLLSQIISCIWYILVEKPIQRAIKYYFFTNQSSKKHFSYLLIEDFKEV